MPKENIKDRVDGNEIDLSMSSLETKTVPVKELAALPKVTSVDLSCNSITTLPDSFCSLTHIIRLDLSKNDLIELPQDFGNLVHLQHLDLLGNKLTTLPRSFSRLKKLKWLDLKDNQLEAGLKKNAGDCLDEMQCKKCAMRILMYMTDLDAQLEVQYQKKMAKQREEEARQKATEEKERQRIRAEKKAEKERRRRELENKRNQERLAQSDDTSDEDFKAEQEALKPNHKDASHSKGGSFIPFILFSLFALAIALLVAADFYCQHEKKEQMCVKYWQPARRDITKALVSSKKMILKIYHTNIAPYFSK